MAVEEPKIFSEFDLHEVPKLREWEVHFGIGDRDGVKARKSNLSPDSILNLP